MDTRRHLSGVLTLLLPALLILPRQATAQTVAITFEATLNGTSVPLDSVSVENLDSGGDTTLYLVNEPFVLGTVGVGEVASGRDLFRSMPNPFVESTDIVVISTGGELLLAVHDATGREVAAQRVDAMPGQHRLRFTTGMAGVHFVSVQQNGQRHTHRMVAMGAAGNGSGTLDYLGLAGSASHTKSNRSLFTWESGDELRYTGYITNDGNVLSSVIEQVSVASGTILFAFSTVPGTPCPGGSSVTDIDGNTYTAIQIGSQCWMAGNLTTGRYRDGGSIPHIADNAAWTTGTASGGASCDYNNGTAQGLT